MIYFTSDTHFYTRTMFRFKQRQAFADTEEMSAVIMDNWNRTVRKSDEIYILGDLTTKNGDRANELLRALNGRKYLVRGNHDHFTSGLPDPSLLAWIRDYHELSYCGLKFVLFHYPIAEWNRFFRGSYHLHGHQHSAPERNLANRREGIKRYNVSVDSNNMTPVSIEQIIAFFGQ